MIIHQNSEDEYRKYNCSICGKQILTNKKLKQHQDAVHKNKGFNVITGINQGVVSVST